MISVRLIRPAQMSGQRSVSGNDIHRQLERLIAQTLHMTRIGSAPRFHGCFSMKPIPMPRRRLKVKIVRMGRMKLGREIKCQMQRVREKTLTTPKRVPINTARIAPRRCKKNFGIGSIGGGVIQRGVVWGGWHRSRRRCCVWCWRACHRPRRGFAWVPSYCLRGRHVGQSRESWPSNRHR